MTWTLRDKENIMARQNQTDQVETSVKAETAPRKRYTVNATIDPELFEKIEDMRWGLRMKVSELVSQALAEFVESRESGKTDAK